MEDAAGGVSAKTRTPFELNVSQGHVRFAMHGAASLAVWIDDNLNLGFNKAVITWAHRSYSPSKPCDDNGTCGPSTFHWSNVTITPSKPFTMLRPIGQDTLHTGGPTTVTLPQPAPSNSYLRFAATGNIRVSFDGGPYQAAHLQDKADELVAKSNYFTPVPTGTRTISFQGSARGQDWMIEDVSVWASTEPAPAPAQAPTPKEVPSTIATPPLADRGAAVPTSAPSISKHAARGGAPWAVTLVGGLKQNWLWALLVLLMAAGVGGFVVFRSRGSRGTAATPDSPADKR